MLYYSLQKGGEESSDYSTEVLTPMYENIYVKKFVLFANEKLKYYFNLFFDVKNKIYITLIKTFTMWERVKVIFERKVNLSFIYFKNINSRIKYQNYV